MSGRVKFFLLAAYALPYPFLAMWEDAACGTLWCYGGMLLALTLLGRFAIRKGLYGVMFLGNGLSFLLSLLCIRLFQTEKWLWYFKPLSAVQLLVLLTAAVVFVEFLAWLFKRKKERG